MRGVKQRHPTSRSRMSRVVILCNAGVSLEAEAFGAHEGGAREAGGVFHVGFQRHDFSEGN